MEISNFYILSENFFSTSFQVYPMDLNSKKDENDLSDVVKLLMGDYSHIDFPVIFKHKYGKKLDDLIRTGTAILYLLSEKMKLVLEGSHLTGWEKFPVKILDKKDIEIPGYYGLSITGRCGPIDYNKSNIIKKQLVPNGPMGRYYKGLYVGLDEWDGSDFFIPEKNFGIIITSKAAEVLKKNKLTNIRLVNLKEIEIDEFTVQVAMKNSKIE